MVVLIFVIGLPMDLSPDSTMHTSDTTPQKNKKKDTKQKQKKEKKQHVTMWCMMSSRPNAPIDLAETVSEDPPRDP